ncbi:MAG: T9SS type A sorting domain-containing protein, partial [Salibacteraceae bacterium]
MKSSLKSLLTCLLLVMLFAFNSHAQFGCYDSTKWDITTTNTTGSVSFHTLSDSITMIADGDYQGLSTNQPYGFPFDKSFTDGIVAISITTPVIDTVTFDWTYTPGFQENAATEPFGYMINSAFFIQLTTGGSFAYHTGSASIPLAAGDTLHITLASYFSELGQAKVGISNMSGSICNEFTSSIIQIDSLSCATDSNVTLVAEASNTTGSYTVAWNHGPTTDTINNIGVGTYCAVITDSIGATDSICYTVDVTHGVTTIINVNNHVLCNGDTNASATLLASGGVLPYSFLWDNGEVTDTAFALFPGVHTVQIADSNNCMYTDSILITEPAVLSSTSLVLPFSNSQLGRLSISMSGGTAPYRYLWNNNPQWNTNFLTGLQPGWYVADVLDTNGCNYMVSIYIADSSKIEINVNEKTSILCHSDDNASIYANVEYARGSYTIAWNHGPTTDTLFNMAPGTYCAVVTDSVGKQDSSCVTVIEPAKLTSTTAIKSEILCNSDSTGIVYVISQGGTPPYNFLWSGSINSDTLKNVSAGNYEVEIRDINNCMRRDTIQLTEPALLTATLSSTSTLLGSTNGTATANPMGGITPYQFEWNMNSVLDSSTITGLDSGIYTVVITDSNGCTFDSKVMVEMNFENGIYYSKDKALFSIFPNPTNGKFNLVFTNQIIKTNDLTIQVIDAAGRVVFKSKYMELSNGEIDLNGQSKGVYQLNIISDSTILRGKVVL